MSEPVSLETLRERKKAREHVDPPPFVPDKPKGPSRTLPVLVLGACVPRN